MPSLRSMTGFASLRGDTACGPVSVEIRSVNSRFLDLTLHLPDALRFAEPAVRDTLRGALQRGKVECRIGLSRGESAGAEVSEPAVRALLGLQEKVLALRPGSAPLSVSSILAWPGTVSQAAADEDRAREHILALVGRALDLFTATREREGAALGAVILGHCGAIEATADSLQTAIPRIHQHMQTRLEERLAAALEKPLSAAGGLAGDEIRERIRQEITLYALRMDVDEEIQRLRTHVREVRRIVSAGGAAGKRLDFLMQELNREANTLGSKASAIEMTDASLTMKLAIEQMREQIQNLE